MDRGRWSWDDWRELVNAWGRAPSDQRTNGVLQSGEWVRGMDPPDAVAIERQDVECLGTAHGELVSRRDAVGRHAGANRDSPGSAPIFGRHRNPEIPGRFVWMDT